MIDRMVQFAKSQSRDEIAQQYAVSIKIEPQRLVLALLPFAIASIYVSPWFCMTLALICTLLENQGLRLLDKLDPAVQPKRYLTSLSMYALAQVLFNLVVVLIWQEVDGYAKPFAVGMYFVNLIQLSTVRSVHFPLSALSLIVASVVGAIGNSNFWIASGNMVGLLVSTICLAATIYFVLLTMITVHDVHRDMAQARSEAERANESKSRFLAQISHDLRTPLNAIIGTASAELSLSSQSETRERLTTLVQSGRDLSVLLDDILDLSAVEAGQLSIRPDVVDLRAFVHTTLALFRQQITDARLELGVEIDSAVPDFVVLDKQRLRQCLNNILSNAIKYTPAGQIGIRVWMQAPDALVFDMTDTGPGVPTRLHDLIFQPFQRGETRVVGTGLGLSISRTLARRMGGDLVLLPGEEGARFRLTLTAQPSDAPPPPVHDPSADSGIAGLHVLIVDDVSSNRLVASNFLRLLGATSTEVASGAEALAVIETNLRDGKLPDLVLLDIQMPVMDGVETLHRMRQLLGNDTGLTVLAMTAEATDTNREAYLAAGLDGYISKPMSMKQLEQAILAALKQKTG